MTVVVPTGNKSLGASDLVVSVATPDISVAVGSIQTMAVSVNPSSICSVKNPGQPVITGAIVSTNGTKRELDLIGKEYCLYI